MLSEGCLISFIEGLSNEFYRWFVQWNYIGGLSNGFSIGGSSNDSQKQKSFVLKTVFIHGKCMCEAVRT